MGMKRGVETASLPLEASSLSTSACVCRWVGVCGGGLDSWKSMKTVVQKGTKEETCYL